MGRSVGELGGECRVSNEWCEARPVGWRAISRDPSALANQGQRPPVGGCRRRPDPSVSPASVERTEPILGRIAIENAWQHTGNRSASLDGGRGMTR